MKKDKKDCHLYSPQTHLVDEFEKLVDENKKKDTSINGTKKRFEKELNTHLQYVRLLEDYYQKMNEYEIDNNIDKIKFSKSLVDKHNLEIEIMAQKNIYLDVYVYYEKDFMKKYNNKINKESE